MSADLDLDTIGALADTTAELLVTLVNEGPPGTAARLKQALTPVARAIQERIEFETGTLVIERPTNVSPRERGLAALRAVNESREREYQRHREQQHTPSLAERLGFPERSS